jgi:A/G-specific adenine glycosylase
VYHRFFAKFPNIETLGNASAENILDIIRPLGLKYRAERIRKVANDIITIHSGRIPKDKKALVNLRGIGTYVAQATLCFAYEEDLAIVDANVLRILERFFSLDFGTNGHKRAEAWKFMTSLIPKGRSREFNWTLLDFGDIMCTPRNPMCVRCPLADICDYGLAQVEPRTRVS